MRTFTADGRYIWREREGGEWTLKFDGVYVESESSRPNPVIVIAEGLNMGGFGFEITALDRNRLSMTYLGTDDPDEEGGEQSTWLRCPSD